MIVSFTLSYDGREYRSEESITLVLSRLNLCYSVLTHNHYSSRIDTRTRRFEEPNDPNLPIRTLSNNANLNEYTEETAEGTIARRTITATGEKQDHKLVTFTIDDPENPKNWSKTYKWYITMVIACVCFVVAFCSSVITADIEGAQADLDTTMEIALLSITLFVIGFGLGPMVFAPLSELLGRGIIYATALAVAVIFVLPCAMAKNIETLLVCRLIDGIAFSAPMALVGGTLADLWRTEERGVPMAAFSAAPFLGPAIGTYTMLCEFLFLFSGFC